MFNLFLGSSGCLCLGEGISFNPELVMIETFTFWFKEIFVFLLFLTEGSIFFSLN